MSPAPSEAVLVLAAHGTRHPGGAAVVLEAARLVRVALPTTRVEIAYVDVQDPRVDRVVAQVVASGQRVVVVPFLLTTGYHVEVDIAGAVIGHPGAVAAPALGPDPRLAEALVTRLRQVGATPSDQVVLGVAGSSRASAAASSEQLRDLVAAAWGGQVVLGYAAAVSPSVEQAVAAARAAAPGARVVVAAYLLGPGHFHDVLLHAGADLVTDPLGAAGHIVRIITDRYAAASAQLTG